LHVALLYSNGECSIMNEIKIHTPHTHHNTHTPHTHTPPPPPTPPHTHTTHTHTHTRHAKMAAEEKQRVNDALEKL
jgi:hypothetical protein